MGSGGRSARSRSISTRSGFLPAQQARDGPAEGLERHRRDGLDARARGTERGGRSLTVDLRVRAAPYDDGRDDGRGAERVLLCVPYRVDCLQLPGMDLATDPALAARDRVAHGLFLVRFGRMVRMGVLSMHRLALAGPGPPRPPGPVVICSAAHSGSDRTRSRFCLGRYTGRCDARRCLAAQRRAVRQGPSSTTRQRPRSPGEVRGGPVDSLRSLAPWFSRPLHARRQKASGAWT